MGWVSVNERFPDQVQVIVRYLKPRFGVPTACYEMGYFETQIHLNMENHADGFTGETTSQFITR